ncbi:MAG: alanine racemase, partial [Anaerovoracaceae bacterium]
MLKETLRPVWAEIDLSCIKHNITEIKRRVGNTPIIGVVKANGYGHG